MLDNLMEINGLIVGDGSSDKMLLSPVEWLVRRVFPTKAINLQFADLRRFPNIGSSLRDRISAAIELYDFNMLFIHRDAEK